MKKKIIIIISLLTFYCGFTVDKSRDRVGAIESKAQAQLASFKSELEVLDYDAAIVLAHINELTAAHIPLPKLLRAKGVNYLAKRNALVLQGMHRFKGIISEIDELNSLEFWLTGMAESELQLFSEMVNYNEKKLEYDQILIREMVISSMRESISDYISGSIPEYPEKKFDIGGSFHMENDEVKLIAKTTITK